MSKAAAKTAYGPMSITAAERYLPERHRIVDDPLAYDFLPTAGTRFFTRLSRWSAWRNFVVRSLGEGLYALFPCRKRFIDDKLTAALDDGVDAVVILGAGFDTRGYRLAVPAGVPLYEVDQPRNIAAKRARLVQMYGDVPANATLVPVDFDVQDLGAELAAHGYRPDRTTFFVWEAVTQYLTEKGVRRTFDFLATAAPGSQLAFTYVQKSFVDGTDVSPGERQLYQKVRKPKDPLWKFGIDPDHLSAFLREYGWQDVDQAGATEHRTRYLEPAGRDLPISDGERSVHAIRVDPT